jgi:hypothetical protein
MSFAATDPARLGHNVRVMQKHHDRSTGLARSVRCPQPPAWHIGDIAPLAGQARVFLDAEQHMRRPAMIAPRPSGF